jgi:hypothetical protein
MARPAKNRPEDPAMMHERDRLRLSILPQNAEEPVQYEEFVREQIAQDDEEWKRVQEACDRVFDQHLQNHEALCRAKAVLEAENAELKQQILDLSKELEEDPVTAELRQKLEETSQKLDEVTAERNEMALCFAREKSRAMSVVSATSTPKSQRIADPEQLSDGKEDPKFEGWLLAMERKLTANADRFPTEYSKITYILSRVKGLAYRTMYPRVCTDSKNPYQTAKEVFDHLSAVFADPNRKKQAKREYKELKMKGKTFSEYLQQFSVLAQEAGVDPDDYKDDLYESMTNRMKLAVLNYYNDAGMSFDAFVENCHRTADALASIDMTKEHDKLQSSTAPANRGQSNGKASRSANTVSATAVATTALAEKSPPGGWAPITAEERQRCRLEGLCFYCRQKGHITSNCPKRAAQATASTLKSLEAPPEYAEKEEPKNNQA